MLAKAPTVGHVFETRPTFAEAKTELEDHLYGQTNGIVQSGPFKGMWIPREYAWKETYLPPMLLGCYEEELHGVIEQQVGRLSAFEQPKVLVVGCAEGYYSIGLKRRLPNAQVYAIDKNEKCIEIMLQAAKANEVEILVGNDLEQAFANVDFILMDVEGAEVAYLDFEKFPTLSGSNMLVEVHNWPHQKTDEILLERFRGTHRIDLLFEGPRNPNKYKELCGMISDYRWMAVSEGRPCLMGWFYMNSRGITFK